jgi:alpha/beta superfamily hydrolase
MSVYIFIPKGVTKPYQTVLYGYGSGAFMWRSSQDMENYYEFPAFLEWFVRSGRAVVMPVVKESFERGDQNSLTRQRSVGHAFSEFIIPIVKDYRRVIDYLETRPEFDEDKLCFYGMSFGPTIGQFLTAVDNRIETNIFYAGGMIQAGRTESNPAHFLPRITIPTLMINGKYDANLRMDYEVKYMNELLGTPERDKKLLLFDSDHLAPRADVVRETLIWLDTQFGPVDRGTAFASTEPN